MNDPEMKELAVKMRDAIVRRVMESIQLAEEKYADPKFVVLDDVFVDFLERMEKPDRPGRHIISIAGVEVLRQSQVVVAKP